MDIGEQRRVIIVEPEPLHVPDEGPAEPQPTPAPLPRREPEPVPVRR
jgi:hypothetical protein